ncbi:MAG: glycosyltransferase [Chryseolinea sp.]
MKVLQVIDSLRVGGAEKMVVSIANLLTSSGTQSDVLVIGSEAPLRDQLSANSKVYIMNRKWKWNLLVMWRIRNIAKNYDIVHVHLHYNYLYLRFIQLLFGYKAKLILHDHDNEFFCKGFLWKTLFQPKEYISVNKHIVLIARNYFGKGSACHLVSNFIVVNVNEGVAQGGKGLVMVGNILPVKNYEFVFDIIAGLDFPLTIYGNAYDTEYLNTLKSSIREKQLEERIHFVHNCQNVQPFLAQYDLAIHTAKTESGPLVVLEYMANGLPLITYDTGEIVAALKMDFPEFVLESFDVKLWISQARLIHTRGRKFYTEKLIQNIKSKRLTENYLEQCLTIYRSALHY